MKKALYLFLSFFIIILFIVVAFTRDDLESAEVKNVINKKSSNLAFTIDGKETTDTFPLKNAGYIGESVSCEGGSGNWNNETWKLEITNMTKNVNCIINFVVKKTLLKDQILADNSNVSTRNSFTTTFTTSNNGNTIYSAAGQDGSSTYYFAGSVNNNYVLFGGYYWRIVRINEDNSVRLIYAGTSATDTAGFISTNQKFNTLYNNSIYVGYKYTLSTQHGTESDSAVKTTVDNWYRDNINASYGSYVSKTAIYCNDRTVSNGSWCENCSTFNYSVYTRLITNKTPTFACSNNADKFTASETTGNNALTYPIGLITADEISYAGGMYGTANTDYYIADNASTGASYWWTMSPANWGNPYYYAYSLRVGGSSHTGNFDYLYVHDTIGVRPVLSLKACVEWASGNGTALTPYTVKISEECALVENEILETNTVRLSASTNDMSIATVVTPTSVVKAVGSNHTFTFNVTGGNEYLGIENCNGVYNPATNTLTLTNVQKNTSCKVNFGVRITLATKILTDNPNNTGTRSGFNTVFNESNNGNTIYRATGQGGKTTYYFAGAVTNNYVLFGGYYWRIVRINEDNSVRLIYAGVSADDTEAFATESAFNSASTASFNVGYKYTESSQHGVVTNSLIKTSVENWYKNNINKLYGSYVSKTAVYCNDRTVGSGTWSDTGTPFTYAFHTRVNSNSPTFVCSNAEDRFTVSTVTGNGGLKYPVALITGDEVMFAGGHYDMENYDYYLYENAVDTKNYSYWYTMTPYRWSTKATTAVVEINRNSPGRIYQMATDTSYGVRPVLSLKSCVTTTAGNGKSTSPYEVSISSDCASLEN